MSWKDYETDEIISDDEFEEECMNCRCFCSDGSLSIPCDGDRYDCPYYGEIDD